MEQPTVSPVQLATMFLPSYSLSEISTKSLDELTTQIAYRRRKHSELATGGLTDRQIAERVQEFTHGITHGSPEASLLLEVIGWQHQQTELLRRINGVIQLWGVLLILAILGMCGWLVFGSSLLR